MNIFQYEQLLKLYEDLYGRTTRKSNKLLLFIKNAKKNVFLFYFFQEPPATEDDKAPLPPEMFVPNQKRWLELRARDKKVIMGLNCTCLCAGMDVY